MLPREDYLKSLARKRNAAGLILLVDGKILIVKPNYKDVWLLPGGVVDELESPLAAARRECREELGFDPVIDRLLLVDYRCEDSATDGWHEALHFVFLVQLPSDFRPEQIAIPNNELDEWKLVTPADSATYLSPHSARRVIAALACLNAPAGYAEDGIAKA
jgi:8-oxo-dGTP diphosphatase